MAEATGGDPLALLRDLHLVVVKWPGGEKPMMLLTTLNAVRTRTALGESNATDTYRSFLVDGLSQAIASTQPLKLNQYLKSVDHEK